MSEEIQKSAEEVLADVVKSEVTAVADTKADKADLEAVKTALDGIEVPSVEGFAKSEEVAEVAKAVEELTAQVLAAPSISKGADMQQDTSLILEAKMDGKTNHFAKEVDFTKAYSLTGSNAQVTGAPTAAMALYHQLQQMNPFRMVSTVMPTSSGSVELPSVTGITAAVENTALQAIDGASGHAGTLASTNVRPQNWVSRTIFSDAATEDLPTLDATVASFMMQAIARAEAGDMVTNLDSNTSITEVHTGQAAALPDGIEEWASLVATLDSAYKPNAKFMMSRAALSHLRSTDQAADGSDLIIDPSSGNFKLWGYDIVVNDHMDDGDTANDNAVYFGDFTRGTIIVSRKEATVGRFEDTLPGSTYYYGNMRSRGTVWDANALVRFSTEA